MLEMINVSYAYKSKKEIVHVLDKVTYRFEIGEMYGIFGEDIQILFLVFRYYTHICTVKFGHLFSGKGQTKKSSML